MDGLIYSMPFWQRTKGADCWNSRAKLQLMSFHFPNGESFPANIYWHISLDHCLVLLLPMQKTGLSQEYRQSSRTRCQVFCKVQSTHQGVALIPDLESDRVWSCCHQQIWLQADLPRTSCKPCGLQSNFALECRKQRNMIESGEPILSGKPVVISRWKTRHLG